MSDMQFADNYRDLSNSTGVDAGFQFEFHCDCCSDRWRTDFKPYRSAHASRWLQKGASLFDAAAGDEVLYGVWGAAGGMDGARPTVSPTVSLGMPDKTVVEAIGLDYP